MLWKWRPSYLLVNPLAIAWPTMAKRPRTCNAIKSSINPLIVESTLVTYAQICLDHDPSAKKRVIDRSTHAQIYESILHLCYPCTIDAPRRGWFLYRGAFTTLDWINRDVNTNAKTCTRPWKEAPKLVWNSYCALRKACDIKIKHSIVVTYCNREIREKKLIWSRRARLYDEWQWYFECLMC